MSAFLFSAASDKPFIRSCTIRVHSFHKKLVLLDIPRKSNRDDTIRLPRRVAQRRIRIRPGAMAKPRPYCFVTP